MEKHEPTVAPPNMESWTNAGRWGSEDQLGTLNYITPEARVHAAGLVQSGITVSLSAPIRTRPSPVDPRPAWHVMHLETERPYATADSLHLQVHGLANTHLDALGHMFLDGIGYNGRLATDVVDMHGLRALDVSAMRHGIFTRGVLLDVSDGSWLTPGTEVSPDMLEAAERRQGVCVGSGDALFVHVGLERREGVEGPEQTGPRAGLSTESIGWLHRREVAVYSGDCIERLPELGFGSVAMPLHQIGIARMGLVLLDCPSLTDLMAAAVRLGRWDFLFTVAPLHIPGATGSPVNPLAVF